MSGFFVSLASYVGVCVLAGIISAVALHKFGLGRRTPMLRAFMNGYFAAKFPGFFFTDGKMGDLSELGIIMLGCVAISGIQTMVLIILEDDDWWNKRKKRLKKLGKAFLDKLASLTPPAPLPAPAG